MKLISLFRCTVAIGLLLATNPVLSLADPPPPVATVSLTWSEASEFATFLRAARQRTGISFLIEDAPLHVRLTSLSLTSFKEGLVSRKSPAEQIVFIAGLYDYDVIPVTPSFSIWRKRYSDPNDIPNVTYEEVRDSIHRLNDLFRSFAPPDMPEVDSILSRNHHSEMIRMLTPQQKEQASLPTGLAVRQLSPQQKARFWEAVLNISTPASRMYLSTANYNLEVLRSGRAEFGYAYVIEAEPQAKDIAFVFPFRDSPRFGKTFLSSAASAPIDPEESNARGRLAPFARTIPALLEQVSLLPPESAGAGKPETRVLYQAELALTNRTMLFVGAFPKRHTEAAKWVSGINAAFNWQARTSPDPVRARLAQTLVQVRREPPKAIKRRDDFKEFHKTLQSLLPDPVRRSLLLDKQTQLLQEQERLNSEQAPVLRTSRNALEAQNEMKALLEERERLTSRVNEQLQAMFVRTGAQSRAAKLRLRDDLNARLAKNTGENRNEIRLRVSSLSDREKSTFLLGELYPALNALRGWLLSTPTYIKQFDDQHLVLEHPVGESGKNPVELGIGGYTGTTFEVYQKVTIEF